MKMLKDIHLTQSPNNCYDWTFDRGDLRIDIGNSQLKDAVTHALLLHMNELNLLLYVDKGSNVQYYISNTAKTRNKEIVEEEIIRVCKQIRGVNDARTDITFEEKGLQIRNITLVKDDGSEVRLDEI